MASILSPRTSERKSWPVCINFGCWGNCPSHRNPLCLCCFRAAGSRIVVCDGGLRLFQEAFVRGRTPTAKWKSTLGATHPRNQHRREDTTVRAVAQDSIRYVVTWSPTIRSCRGLGSLLEMPFVAACIVNAHDSRLLGLRIHCTLPVRAPTARGTSNSRRGENQASRTRHHRK